MIRDLVDFAILALVAGAVVLAFTPNAARDREIERRIRYTAALPRRPRQPRQVGEWISGAMGFLAAGAFVALMIVWLLSDVRDVDAWIIAHRPF